MSGLPTPDAGRAGLAPALAIALALGAPPDGAVGQTLPGVELGGALIGDAVGVVAGGRERAWAALYDVDLQLRIHGDALGWAGGRLFLYVLGNGGDDPSALVGDYQVVDNIEAPDTWKLFEAWIQQAWADGRASIRAGLYDLNTEFDVLRSGLSLLNSSFGIGPDFSQSGLNGPSIFPTTSLGLRVRASLGEKLQVRTAVLDGVSGDPGDPEGTQVILAEEDGLLLAGEVEYALPRGRAAAGAWGYTRTLPTNRARLALPGAGDETDSSFGAYALVERRLFPEGDPDHGLRAFLRAGFAAGRVNRIGAYVGAGGSYAGLLPGRPHDELALGIGAARNSDEFVAARRSLGRPVERWEVAIETTYVLTATEWLTVQPDVQIVLNPGTEPSLDDAVVLGLRAILHR